MYMVMFVLDNPDQLDAVLEAWRAIGVSGVTILESTGMHRRTVGRGRHLPLRYDFAQTQAGVVETHCTLFVIVPDRDMAAQCLAAVEQMVGDLDEPQTGVLAAWPLDIVKGVPG